jgi:hypothetical protein
MEIQDKNALKRRRKAQNKAMKMARKEKLLITNREIETERIEESPKEIVVETIVEEVIEEPTRTCSIQ